MSRGDSDGIRRRDEILQVMFWLRGEGLGEEVGAAEIGRLLDDVSVATLEGDLAGLLHSGLVEAVGAGRFRLSVAGLEEGGRRFHEEFAELMHQGHGACNDPTCDCHSLGPEACASNAIPHHPHGR